MERENNWFIETHSLIAGINLTWMDVVCEFIFSKWRVFVIPLYICICYRVGLLAFHLTLVNNPQDALVVWAFASVLYHGEWEKGIKFAKEHAKMYVNFAPEIRTSSIYKSDEEIAKAVTKLASLVMHSIPALVESNSLLQSMSRYPSFPQSDMVSKSILVSCNRIWFCSNWLYYSIVP